MPHAYTEDRLVEQPAIGLFVELGWAVAGPPPNAGMVGEPRDAGLLGRETKGEVVLVSRLRAALERMNPALPPEAITAAVDELTRDRSAMGLPAANREVYRLLKEGVAVSIAAPEAPPSSPAFLPGGEGRAAVPSTSGRGTKGEGRGGDGSLTADWERWVEWKRIEREDEPRRVSLEVMLRGTCDRTRLLDLVENFTLFSEHKAGLVKIIGQNHQFLGVNNAIASMLAARKLGHGRGGVFWQTQGSGKSFSMVFFAQKVLRKTAGNWTFVVVTDRVELDDQIPPHL